MYEVYDDGVLFMGGGLVYFMAGLFEGCSYGVLGLRTGACPLSVILSSLCLWTFPLFILSWVTKGRPLPI
jgi:hypothetical protein